MAIPMLNERKVNTAFAIVAIVLSVVAGLAGIVGTAHMLEGMVEGFFSDYEFGYGQMFGGMVAAIFAGIFGILAAVFYSYCFESVEQCSDRQYSKHQNIVDLFKTER